MRQKNIFYRIVYSQKFLTFLGFCIIVLISFPLVKNMNKQYKIDQEIKDLEESIVGLNSKNKDLKKLITYLESNQFVEESARLSLGMKKKGEKIIVIQEFNSEQEDNNENLLIDSNENFKIVSNPKKWVSYFFN